MRCGTEPNPIISDLIATSYFLALPLLLFAFVFLVRGNMHKLRAHLSEQIEEGDTTDKRIFKIGFWTWGAYYALTTILAINSLILFESYRAGQFLSWL